MELRDQLQQTLGNAYALERELGGGGIARVFVARETTLDREVVVKMLPAEVAGSVSIDRFKREIAIAAHLAHPHIIPVLSAGDVDGQPYYTMPFAGSDSLRTRLAQGELPIATTIALLRDVAKALAYAHEKGVVHRDIKPDNILLIGHSAAVTDFGIAKAIESASQKLCPTTSGGLALGTPAYIAPEQAAADPATDHRADLYALGCVAYEMLTGAQLFAGLSPQAMIAAHAMRAPEPIARLRPAVPAPLANLVMRLLEKDPDDRPQSAVAVLEALEVAAGCLVFPDVDADELPEARSIAVLPFANTSGDPESEYFSDGMTDEIINALGHLPGLQVASRTSSFAFKGASSTLADIGATLGVATVLEGTVRRAGDRLRITVQLINAADGFHLWSERYDRGLEDVFAVQGEIARAIADRLEITLAGPASQPLVRPGTDDLAAYDFYLKGRYFWAKRGQHLNTAVDYFARSVAADPEFAAPHAGLADSYVILAVYGYVPSQAAFEKARTAAYRALALNDRAAESHCAVGLLELYLGWNLKAAERELRRATELNPSSAIAYAWLTLFMTALGRTDEARAAAECACRLEPLSPLVNVLAGLSYCLMGSFDRAWDAAQRVVELDPAYPVSYWVGGWVHQHEGRYEEAVTAFERAATLSGRAPLLLTLLSAAYVAAGRREHARDILVELDRRDAQAGLRGAVSWQLGDDIRAFDLLERGVQERNPWLVFSGLAPGFEEMSDDGRWGALLEPTGLRAVARARKTKQAR